MINWPEKPANPYFTESECKNWRINKAAVRRGTKIVMVYRLWQRNGEKWTPKGTTFETAELAKQEAI